jgi:hypothetical protein
MQEESQLSTKPHAKVVSVLIICGALVATTFVYAEKNTLFGDSAPSQNTASITNLAVTADQNPLAGLQLQNATGTVTIVNPSVLSTVNNSNTQASSNTLTAKVSQELFARLTADQQNGVTIDDTEATNIANQTILDNAPTSQAFHYTVSDIHISQDSSVPAIHAYEQAIVAAAQKDTPMSMQDPITIVSNATQLDPSSQDPTNPSAVNQLNSVISDYKNLIRDTLDIQVPQQAVGYHMVYLNTLSSILYDIEQIHQVLTDPVTSYIGLTNYQTDMVQLQTVVQQAGAALP